MSKYKFILDIQNTTNVIIDVTTADFEVVNTETGKREETLDFFHQTELLEKIFLLLN